MSQERVSSELFVGRVRELKDFDEFLHPEAPHRILNIHSAGEGGIGKTRLLLKMLERCTLRENELIVAAELIDFYHTESHSQIGVMQQVVNNLGQDHFPDFLRLLVQYQTSINAGERSSTFNKLERTFQAEYAAFSTRARNENKSIVFFFDTYEFIQRLETGSDGEVALEEGSFAHWVETGLFPVLAERSKLIVSGRYPLQMMDRSRLPVQECELSHFNFAETLDFWKDYCSVRSDSALQEKIGVDSLDELELIHELADGRPILLALFLDWVFYDRNPFLPQDLLEEIERHAGCLRLPVTKEQQGLFEKTLIDRVGNLANPEDRTVRYMAVAHRRMTPDMLAFLTGGNIEESRKILLERLRALSFVKYKEGRTFYLSESVLEALNGAGLAEEAVTVLRRLKGRRFFREELFWEAVETLAGHEHVLTHKTLIERHARQDVVLLHDEMRRLLLQYWWERQDPAFIHRQELCKKLMEYYQQRLLDDQTLSGVEREAHTSELLEYAFQADPERGLRHFCREFDIAMEDGRYDYCDVILRDAELFQRRHPDVLSFPVFLEITRRRVQFVIEREGDYANALQEIEDLFAKYENESAWKRSDIQGYLWRLKGVAEFWAGSFEEALRSFERAKGIFYDFDLDLPSSETANWIGYLFYRQGNFELAMRWWLGVKKQLSRLLEQKRQPSREYRSLTQLFQLAIGNLAVVYRLSGRMNISIQHAEMLLNIVYMLPRNDREIARTRITACYALQSAGYTIDAGYHAERATSLLKEIQEPLLSGRLQTNLGCLHYRSRELTSLLTYAHGAELNRILEHGSFVTKDEITRAEEAILEAVQILRTTSFIKELADAYYALGEIYMMTHSSMSPNHWEQAEKAFEESLALGKESLFRYRVVDCWTRLSSLYYFWNHAEGVSEQTQVSNFDKLQRCQKEFNAYEGPSYPNLNSANEITLGNIDFEQGIELLKVGAEEPSDALLRLKSAFSHFIKGIADASQFSQERYYLSLRMLHSRINLVIDTLQEMAVEVSDILALLNELLAELRQHRYTLRDELWDGFQDFVQSALLRVPDDSHAQKIEALEGRIRDMLSSSDVEWVLILTSCLLEAYKSMLLAEPENENYRERLILRLNAQSRFFRIVRDEFHATHCLTTAQEEVKRISDSLLQKALRAYTACSEGRLEYRRGVYGRFLEFYLWDELERARGKFDRQFPGSREKALSLLYSAERDLLDVLAEWELRLVHLNGEQQSLLQNKIREYRSHLGEARFRIGELLILNQSFDANEHDRGAFHYLRQAIEDSREGDDEYRYESAVESYVTALYFSGQTELSEERKHYEKILEGRREGEKGGYCIILGRLRITQGDVLFSECFRREVDSSGWFSYKPSFELHSDRHTGETFVPEKIVVTLRSMIRCYVEACNFMAQAVHAAAYYATSLRVLQRRIELLPCSAILDIIQDALCDAWSNQENLMGIRDDDLTTLTEFAKIRSAILEHENNA